MLLLRSQQIHHLLRASFSTTAACRANGGFISNIGKQPIPIPPSVELLPSPSSLSIKGPLGTTEVPLHPFMQLNFLEPKLLHVQVEDPTEKKQRSMWGLTRTLISNAIQGMTEGFCTPIYLVGVGYRAALEPDPRGKLPGYTGQRLTMKLGYSHSVTVPIPEYIRAEVETPTKIVISCTDKQKLGQFAAKVRSWRPPEPYKGKGIFVGDERARRKVVKKK